MIVEREETELVAAYYHEIGDLLAKMFLMAPRGSSLRARIDVALRATRANEASAMNLLLSYQNVPEDGVLKMTPEALN